MDWGVLWTFQVHFLWISAPLLVSSFERQKKSIKKSTLPNINSYLVRCIYYIRMSFRNTIALIVLFVQISIVTVQFHQLKLQIICIHLLRPVFSTFSGASK